jgi:hypothetical protein
VTNAEMDNKRRSRLEVSTYWFCAGFRRTRQWGKLHRTSMDDACPPDDDTHVINTLLLNLKDKMERPMLQWTTNVVDWK